MSTWATGYDRWAWKCANTAGIPLGGWALAILFKDGLFLEDDCDQGPRVVPSLIVNVSLGIWECVGSHDLGWSLNNLRGEEERHSHALLQLVAERFLARALSLFCGITYM